MFKRFVKYLLIAITFISIIGNKSFVVAEQTGNITIDMIVQEDVNGNRINKAIPGVTFDVYKVWHYDKTDPNDIKIVLESAFENVVTITSDMSEDQIQKTVDKFVDKVDDNTEKISNTVNPTDSNGRTVITDLEEGGYLIIQREPTLYEGVLYEASPFLITVPRLINNRYVYDVEAFPKLKIVTEDTPLDKKVNGLDHYNLRVNYEPVTYTITTTIPSKAKLFEVSDTLVDVLEFVKDDPNFIRVRIDNERLSEEEVNEKLTIEGQKLSFLFDSEEELKELGGKKLVIDFKAKIKQGADLSKYIDKKVPNDCSYKINNEFEKRSKPVTITPPPDNPPPPPVPPTSAKGIRDIIISLIIKRLLNR